MSELVSQFHFLRPMWLWGLIPSLLVWWALNRGRDPRLGLADDIAPHLLNQLVSRPSDRPRFRPTTMILPLALLAVLALAGPSFRQQPSPFAEDESQLMLCVKISPSMMTEDIQPSRLERVRMKIRDLLQLRKGAGAGLVAYAGSAHLVMPATTDGDVLNHMLQALDPDIMPTDGDALDSALQACAKQLTDRATPGSILVVADSVEPSQLTAIRNWREANQLNVQFMVPLRDEAALARSGILPAADALAASVQQITSDDKDIEIIAKRADRAIVSLPQADSMQWRDEGYWFVPILALGVLLWSRRGWSLA